MRGRGARGRGGRFAAGQRPVSEGNRISIADQLAGFQASEETEYSFDAGLNNHDRAIVHSECRKYGFTSKSYGKGQERAVTVFKAKGSRSRRDSVFDLSFQPSSVTLLNQHFKAFPPSPQEVQAAAEGLSTDPAHLHKLSAELSTVALASGADTSLLHDPTGPRRSPKKHKAGVKGAASFSSQQVAARWQSYQTKLQLPEVQQIAAARSRLPIAGHRQQILDAVASNQVVLIRGETGCGKTTQVPQYLLDASWEQGQPCRVLCTQPRRISAVSVADRVATERGESIGDTVAYTIRLESKGGAHSSLMFCTNGVLLRMLTSGDGLKDVTHIVVDEIHERDKFADFLLIMLRDLLPSQPRLRLVLMSATLDAALFTNYFHSCPLMDVPGFTYPVQDFYLEDVLKFVGYRAPANYAPQLAEEGKASDALGRLQAAATEQAIMNAFLTGGEDSWQKLLEVTGAQEGGGNPACINASHAATGAIALMAAAERRRLQQATMHASDKAFAMDVSKNNSATALMAAAGRGRLHEIAMLLAAGANASLQSKGGTAREWALRFGHSEAAEMLQEHEAAQQEADAATEGAVALSHYQQLLVKLCLQPPCPALERMAWIRSRYVQANTDADEVDLQLIVTVLKYICGEGAYKRPGEEGLILGAVLVFLPGWDEIIRLKEQLEGEGCFRGGRYHILPLHSMVPTQDQRKVFLRPPQGVRKIILATNIAETAVTIDDIVCIINSGRLKEKSYDPYTGVSTLQAAWVSKASERQRRGRAGRCQPGMAFHCYSRTRSQALAEVQMPELKRSPLDELCLQVKMLEGAAAGPSVADFLSKAVEPPVDAAVQNALRLLEDIGAIQQGTEALTKLGQYLAPLPLPPRVGKMLLFGVMFGCLDPVLTVACCMAYRDPWVLPVEAGARQAAIARKNNLAESAGGASDHLALVKAFNAWSAAKRVGQERACCASHFLSSSTMMMVHGMRGQLLAELQTQGLVESLATASLNAANGGLVRSVLACGFYPQVGRLLPPKGNQGGPHGKAVILTARDEKVMIHSSSVNSQLAVPEPQRGQGNPCHIVLYDEVTRGESQLYVRQCTAAGPHALLMVAAHLGVSQEDDDEEDEDNQPGGSGRHGEAAILSVDNWLRLRLPMGQLAHVCCLRHRLTQAFALKVASREPWSEAQQAAVEVIGQVLSEEAAATQGSSDLGTSLSGSQPPFGGAFRGRGRGRGPPGRRHFGTAFHEQPNSDSTSWRNQQDRRGGHADQHPQQSQRFSDRDIGSAQYQRPVPHGQYSDYRQPQHNDQRQPRQHRGRGRHGAPPGLGRGGSQQTSYGSTGRGRGGRT